MKPKFRPQVTLPATTNLNPDKIADEAMRAHRAGKFDVAESLVGDALSIDRNHFPSLVHLAVLLRNRGEFRQSRHIAERAVASQPARPDGYTQLALSTLGSALPGDAIPHFERAISLSPPVAALHYHLGLALENVGRNGEAKQEFKRAAEIDPKDVRAALSLGSLLLNDEDLEGAREIAELAIRQNPYSAQAHQFMAKVWVAANNPAQAERCIRESLKLDPRSAYGHFMLGFRMLQTGKFDEAEKECRRSIELDPAQGTAYFGITQARKMTESDRPLIERMLRVVHGSPLTLDQASYLHFGLGKAFDNLGEYEKAMHHFDEAHRNAHLMRFRDKGFDQDEYRAEIASIAKVYSRERFTTAKESGYDSNLPIFVVGMMRSGTTLTEQILSSHPKIGAAGEQWFWAQKAMEAEFPGEDRVDLNRAKELAQEYCRELKKLAPDVERVTDKLPGNYLRLGLLSMALPKAKFIHCRRNPVDTSLSIYFTANPVAPAYTHSKEDIAFVYRQYLELMDHWRSVLPSGCLHEIQYEELVADPEPVIRGMLEFLEIDWDEACLHHDQNDKEVRTPSLWQVRQPMYSTSVERWRRYERWLGPLAGLLDDSPPVGLP